MFVIRTYSIRGGVEGPYGKICGGVDRHVFSYFVYWSRNGVHNTQPQCTRTIFSHIAKTNHEEHRYKFLCDTQDLCKLYVHSLDRKIVKSILSWPMHSKSSMLSVHRRPILPVVPLGIAIRLWVPSSIESPCVAREVRLAAKEVVLASDRQAHLVEFGEHNLNPT